MFFKSLHSWFILYTPKTTFLGPFNSWLTGKRLSATPRKKSTGENRAEDFCKTMKETARSMYKRQIIYVTIHIYNITVIYIYNLCIDLISDVYIHTKSVSLKKKHILHIPLGNTFCFASLRIGMGAAYLLCVRRFNEAGWSVCTVQLGETTSGWWVGSPTHLKHMRTVKLDHETPIRGEHEKNYLKVSPPKATSFKPQR